MATLIKQVKSYVTRQGNAGQQGLAMIEQCIDHMFEHGDWTPLAWLIAKSETRDSTIFRGILRETTGGVSLVMTSKEAKEQPSGMKINVKDNAGVSDKMPILRQLVKDGKSFRSADVKTELFDHKPAEFNLKAYAKRLQSKLEKEGCTIADLLAAFEPIEPSKGSRDQEPPADVIEAKKAA